VMLSWDVRFPTKSEAVLLTDYQVSIQAQKTTHFDARRLIELKILDWAPLSFPLGLGNDLHCSVH